MYGSNRDFSKLIVEKGIVSQEQLEYALHIHTKQEKSLCEILINLGYVDEKDLMIFLSTYFSVPPVNVLNLKISPEILKLIPKDIVRKYDILPLGRIKKTLTVAVVDPFNVLLFEDLEKITGCSVNPVLASRSDIRQVLDVYYKESISSTISEIIKDSEVASLEFIQHKEEEIKDDDIRRSVEEAPVIKLTNYIFKKAVEEKASDILIEPLANFSRVRYRIDGILREAQMFPKNMHSAVISRVKVIANLDITEHRVPQDGRFRMNIFSNNVDFRVSILPATSGEKIAIRVLDKSARVLNLDYLGYGDDVVKQLKDDSLSSFGMMLVCGPTGSGKTTTLYSVLRHIYTPEKNLITVEDPIEYQLSGINQVNVNEEVNLTFANSLRSILRQDPDVIMVGEIRDKETVDIAIKAALTGHLVLSTLHTTTAAGSVTRLINMGVEPFLIASTVVGILAQRLARKLCPKCKEVYSAPGQVRERLKIPPDSVIYKPQGCQKCTGIGYKGRVAVAEYLRFSREIKRLVDERANEHVIKRTARSQGMRTLREDGIRNVLAGITSLEEVFKTSVADE